MAMSRFFVRPEDVGENTIRIENREDLHHMMKALRLSAGDEIDVSDSSAWEYRVKLLHLDAAYAEARILDKQSFTAEPGIEVTLFQGIPKQGKMETIVQKCVELGVWRIVPVFMARTVVVDKGNFGKKIERWQKVSCEAVKQCKRGIIPEVAMPIQLADAVKEFEQFDLVLFPYENETGMTIKDVLRQELACRESRAGCNEADHIAAKGEVCQTSDRPPGRIDPEEGAGTVSAGLLRRIAVIIGPEGGFSAEEAETIVNAGGRSVSLGRTTLRTETAGLAAMAMIMYELEL